MRSNARTDYLDLPSLQVSSAQFLGAAGVEDAFTTPLAAPPGWWRGVRVADADVAVVVGEFEMFLDDMRAWVEKFRVRTDRLFLAWLAFTRRVPAFLLGFVLPDYSCALADSILLVEMF
jgi:hypothetical protein